MRVVKADTDRYGRLVGQVYVGNLQVNRQMVGEGMAWVYLEYLEDKSLLQLEQAARAAKRGLWSLPSAEQVPPGEWRRGKRTSTAEAAEGERGGQASFKCGSKRTCKEMTSCEEARYYLEECGLSRLDGDKDEVPCEALCN